MAKSLKKSIGFAESLSKRAKYAGRGFFVLSGAIGAARYFNEDNAKERSGIILETAGSLSAGAGAGAAGMAISAALLSNPAGWAVIVGVTLVSLAAGYAGGEIGKAAGEALHDAIGDKDDDIFEALIP
jgi:phage tail tape-measure protein